MTDLSQLTDAQLLALAGVAAPTPPAPLAAPGSADDPSAGGGTLQFGPWNTGIHTPQAVDRVLSGAGRGMEHTLRSLGNLFGLVPDSDLDEEKRIDAPLMDTTAGKVGNLIGESAITAPLGMGAGAAVGRLGAAGARAAANPLANAMIQGGAQGLATSDPGSRGVDTALGAATGGATTLGGKALAKAMTGLKRTPDAQLLLDHGVDLTPGQMNPTGVANQLEEATSHAPVLGPLVGKVRDQAEHQWAAAVINKVAAPGAQIKPSADIADMLQQAHASYEPLYDQAKGFPVAPRIVNTAGPDVPLSKAFDAATKAPGVVQSQRDAAQDWLSDQLTQLPKGGIQSDHLIDLRSDIRKQARDYKLKSDSASVGVGQMYDRAANAVTNALRSQLPPEAMTALDTADSNYGAYKIVEDAVARSKDNVAGLTPQKLSQAVYDATQSPQYARGQLPTQTGSLRDLAKAGGNVFQTVVPPNGKTVTALSAAALAGYTHPAVSAVVGGGLAAGTMTPLGRRIAQGATAPQVKAQQLIKAMQGAIPANARPALSAAGQIGQRALVGAGMPAVANAPSALATAMLLKRKEEGGAAATSSLGQ
jgi:hypothetical protein